MATTRIILSAPAPRLSGHRRKSDDSKSHSTASNSFGVVYVNEIARHALLNERKPQFPIGSIIVREKLMQANDTKPVAMVLMVKRERGFNRKANDWEFLMLDGSMSKVSHREKTGECRDCHVRQKNTDYVFRSYLSEDVRRSQK